MKPLLAIPRLAAGSVKGFIWVILILLLAAPVFAESSADKIDKSKLRPLHSRAREQQKLKLSAENQKLVNWIKSNTSPRTQLPLSFQISKDEETALYKKMGGPDSITAIIERIIVEEGVSVYDAALAQIVLAMAGGTENLKAAYVPVKVYWDGYLNDLMILRTGGDLYQPFVYDPDNPYAVSSELSRKGERGFVFRIINANGIYNTKDPLDGKTTFAEFPTWATVHWEDWKPIAGENAWVVLASLHLYHRKYYVPGSGENNYLLNAVELQLAEEIARAALLLQAENGGIRMAPIGTYYNLADINNEASVEEVQQQLDEAAVKYSEFSFKQRRGEYTVEDLLSEEDNAFAWYYNEISTENNISWYAALRMLFTITRKPVYKQAMEDIEVYFKAIWNSKEGIFYQGAHFSNGEWQPNSEYFATDVQNWAIMALGPERIDKWFGDGAAYRLWKKTKEFSGCRNKDGRLLGVGYVKEHDRVAIEWTAGAIFAAKMISVYYRDSHADWAKEVFEDARDMREGVEGFRKDISASKAAYSYSSKRGWIPFGWFSHFPEVLSTVSTSWVVLLDSNFNPFYLSD